MESNEKHNAEGTGYSSSYVGLEKCTSFLGSFRFFKVTSRQYTMASSYGNYIQNGPTHSPFLINDPPPNVSAAVPCPRKKIDSEFSRIYSKRRKICLIEYGTLRDIGTRNQLWTTFVRFHKLVNVMKCISSTFQLSDVTPSLSNLTALLGYTVQYVIMSRQNMVSNTPYFRSTLISKPTSLMQKDLRNREQSTSIVDPLAYAVSTNNIQSQDSYISRTNASVHDGQLLLKPIQMKASGNVGNTGARGKKEIWLQLQREGHVERLCPMLLSFHGHNLSSTSATNSQVMRSHSKCNPIFDMLDYPVESGDAPGILETQVQNSRGMLNVRSMKGACDQQALETDRIQLKDTITSLRIQLDGLKVENVSLKRWYDELSQANTHSRTAYTEKLVP
ncbi:hypothetical protein Tco_0634613 [Tanacetum coccineum]|uniref:Uncharacterized protein n=1 Tax=Tanacetum coccineum TaxID=301880 RepID=A0ABQ5F281_9ASTR